MASLKAGTATYIRRLLRASISTLSTIPRRRPTDLKRFASHKEQRCSLVHSPAINRCLGHPTAEHPGACFGRDRGILANSSETSENKASVARLEALEKELNERRAEYEKRLSKLDSETSENRASVARLVRLSDPSMLTITGAAISRILWLVGTAHWEREEDLAQAWHTPKTSMKVPLSLAHLSDLQKAALRAVDAKMLAQLENQVEHIPSLSSNSRISWKSDPQPSPLRP